MKVELQISYDTKDNPLTQFARIMEQVSELMEANAEFYEKRNNKECLNSQEKNFLHIFYILSAVTTSLALICEIPDSRFFEKYIYMIKNIHADIGLYLESMKYPS
jgi:hypothetical protein